MLEVAKWQGNSKNGLYDFLTLCIVIYKILRMVTVYVGSNPVASALLEAYRCSCNQHESVLRVLPEQDYICF